MMPRMSEKRTAAAVEDVKDDNDDDDENRFVKRKEPMGESSATLQVVSRLRL